MIQDARSYLKNYDFRYRITTELKMSKIFKLAHTFNCFYLTEIKTRKCLPFFVGGFQVGLLQQHVITQLLRYPEVFHIHDSYVELNPAFRDYNERSEQIDRVLRELRDEKVFTTLNGWREECYEVRTKYACKSLMKMERSATCLFGIKKYGVSINGYVRHPTKGLCIWLQQRSSTKQTYPDKWDNLVGGGLSVGYGIFETAHKEANEEASIPPELLKNLINIGTISFFYKCERGLFPNTEFVFDLELPLDFIPSNQDGEVQNFQLLTADECLEKVLTPKFKLTSVPVVFDFFIRHGIINAETEPNYVELIEMLHVPLQTMYNNVLPNCMVNNSTLSEMKPENNTLH